MTFCPSPGQHEFPKKDILLNNHNIITTSKKYDIDRRLLSNIEAMLKFLQLSPNCSFIRFLTHYPFNSHTFFGLSCVFFLDRFSQCFLLLLVFCHLYRMSSNLHVFDCFSIERDSIFWEEYYMGDVGYFPLHHTRWHIICLSYYR